MTALGASALFMSSPEVYEKLSRGVIDGVAFTYEAVTAFNLTDHIKYTMTVPGGIYNTAWFMVMNEAKWGALSDADKAAIEPLIGGALAERVGKAWNDADVAAIEEMKTAGIDIYPAPEPVVAKLREAATALEAEWAATVAADYDAVGALSEFRAMTGVATQ